jgi:hypothetical protein
VGVGVGPGAASSCSSSQMSKLISFQTLLESSPQPLHPKCRSSYRLGKE